MSSLVTWHGASYQSNVGHHRRYSPDEIKNLDVATGGTVLDLGCGVGDFAKSLADRFEKASVVGLDSSPDMIATAKVFETSNLRFEVGKAQDLSDEDAYDYIVSTACFHWIPRQDHRGLLKAVHRALRQDGHMIVEFGAAGNVRRTLNIIESVVADWRDVGTEVSAEAPWYFPTARAYEVLLADSPFTQYQVKVISQIRTFTETEFEGWLRSQVVLPWSQQIPVAMRDRFVGALVERALEASRQAPGVCQESFVRLLVSARK